MEVEVSEIFSPAAGKRAANFVVLKYFLLGMMFSNAIESILIVPKTLSLMEENQRQLEHLGMLMEEHEEFKGELHELTLVSQKAMEGQKELFNAFTGGAEENRKRLEQKTEEPAVVKKKHRTRITFEDDTEPMGGRKNEKMIEYMLLIYGIVTMASGIVAVFKELDKLLILFIGTTTLGLVVLFFSGLTLIVFMAILNDVIIALVSFKYWQMMTTPVTAEYMYGGPISVGTGLPSAFPEPAYNVDLNQPATYVTQ